MDIAAGNGTAKSSEAATAMMLLEREHTQTLALRSGVIVLFVLAGLIVLVTWQRRRIDKLNSHRRAVAMRLAQFKRVEYVLNKHREVEMTKIESAPLMHGDDDDDDELKEDDDAMML
ncbi:Aste57867_1448 [Aphanomyces stellatus]|uniref:Aste57867_1448 protein n=1 Tax=Aphanomyces stellatus TaxID=120398 RepID=A0A485K5B4_9STRA|nr:hypothetical protein As57867_001447 [Aphanomyces stellatus]VFT78665.1 Aste57867_1448 [Aphanomyces stellatus]